MRTIEQIAEKMLHCALSWEPGVRLLGDVQAVEIAALAASVIDTCPRCGAAAWVNIDCDLCRVFSAIREDGNRE